MTASHRKAGARLRSLILALAGLLGVAALVLGVLAAGHRRPQDVPWTRLDLGDDIGVFTGRKLSALRGDSAECRALLDRAGIAFTRLPDRRDGPTCGYRDGVRARTTAPLGLTYRPAIGASCAVVAALATWEWQVVQPAAIRHLGTRATAVDDFGTYSCRRIGGGRRAGGAAWSEHSRGNAVDIAGFRLSDGRRVSVLGDWTGTGPKAAFLREVRDGACRLFATTLSPDYNVAHRNHLHLDQAQRGPGGWRACR